MCGSVGAGDPAQEHIPGDQIGSAHDLTGKLLLADGAAQGVLTDIDAVGESSLHGLLDVHDGHVIVHLGFSFSMIFRNFAVIAGLFPGF